ncbi:hypothetical protein PMI16_04233 [Herbaspirillum sp. CF444]|uniref:hypothetical protein n=1 Tax=Herbaspirillum sp. CF444 TaxID=1144319 RepID=UPI000272466A|nr:hypothetical protein PMI16_04233 [Herbaspirillum sp. CF444]
MRAKQKFATSLNSNTQVSAQRDFVMQPPEIMDRITFNTLDDDILVGFVAAIRRHVGNGEKFAWVKLDNEPTGAFRAVPLARISSSDGFGRWRSAAP